MESTGARGKIQVSQTTADLIIRAGKPHWVRPREDTVQAKGKGVLNTYWLNLAKHPTTSDLNGSETQDSLNPDGSVASYDPEASLKQERLVGWMVELLADHIKKIVSLVSPGPYFLIIF